MSDLDRLNNAKPTSEYDDYSEYSTDKLLELERNLSSEYYRILKLGDLFDLDDYAEIIRELTIREEDA
tara:strand:- start:21 stop:224 length:204 start_codon:yes stop_codon:yes gene_type:complete